MESVRFKYNRYECLGNLLDVHSTGMTFSESLRFKLNREDCLRNLLDSIKKGNVIACQALRFQKKIVMMKKTHSDYINNITSLKNIIECMKTYRFYVNQLDLIKVMMFN